MSSTAAAQDNTGDSNQRNEDEYANKHRQIRKAVWKKTRLGLIIVQNGISPSEERDVDSVTEVTETFKGPSTVASLDM